MVCVIAWRGVKGKTVSRIIGSIDLNPIVFEQV